MINSKCPECDDGLIKTPADYGSSSATVCPKCTKGCLPFKFRMPIKVPNRYRFGFVSEDNKAVFGRCGKESLDCLDCEVCLEGCDLKNVDIPYQLNQIVDVTCDACGGVGCNYIYDTFLIGWDAIHVCLTCNGLGKAQAKVLSIIEVTNEHIEYEAIREG